MVAAALLITLQSWCPYHCSVTRLHWNVTPHPTRDVGPETFWGYWQPPPRPWPLVWILHFSETEKYLSYSYTLCVMQPS